MSYYLDQLKKQVVEKVCSALGVEADDVVVEQANEKVGADFAVPCFKFAASLGKSPNEIAEELASKFDLSDFEKVETAGGFVNLWLDANKLAAGVISDLKDKQNYGESEVGKGKKVVVDFVGPNLAKPFSVGHLRPTNQGWAIINLLRAQGYEVVGDSHIGDWGTPFGKWVVGFKKYSSDEQLEKDGVYELARVYIKITEELKAQDDPYDNELYKEVREWLKKLEAGDKEAVEYHERFMKISLDHMHEVLERLKVHPDEELGESFYIDKAKAMVANMVEEGVAVRQDDGSVIVDLKDYDMDTPILLEKSDGTSLYATTDIATIDYRVETWNPDEIVYVVAAEQQFHFKQLFALADKLGYKVPMVHVWFGLIQTADEDGKRSKMSSRKGTTSLEALLDKAAETAKEKFPDSRSNEEDQEKIAIGAVKFSDFAQSRQTNILFDWDRIFSLHGFSGPYIQYAAVRASSILKKDEAQAEFSENIDWSKEKGLFKKLAEYPGVISEATEEYEPHKLAQYLFDLAHELNRYYEEVQINGAEGEQKVSRRGLVKALHENFVHGLGILGIEVPEEM